MKDREQIGKVWLDFSKYPGEDFYCDGAVEDELLDIARNYSTIEFPRLIEERASWPVMYHLSAQRENIVEFLPITKADKVLEVGSGCGAITGVLARKAGNVTCVDLSKKRSSINAYRHEECDNVTIHVGNFKDIEPDLPADYDYICLIGVFEYGQSYIGGEQPYVDFLNILKKHLKKNGRIVIAIENKYGLKYFAGCMEDHLGNYFSGIEDYAAGGGVRTFSKQGLENIFKDCGVGEYHFYYPYPDYKFMTTVYSDKKLPGVGELSNNLRNFDRDRMLLFDEKNAFDGLTREGYFPVFSNSFLVVLGEDIPVEYARYSNDRAPEYQIKTVICQNAEGVKEVRKYPLTEEAREHVEKLEVAYESLLKRYEGSALLVNRCRMRKGDTATEGSSYAAFEFVQGRPLSELMDECLKRQDEEGFMKLFEEYLEKVSFGEEDPVADFDLVFSNIMVEGETWTLLDYEWTFGKQMDTKVLAFRAVYCYLLEDEKRNSLPLDRILDRLGITERKAQEYREQEMEFQKFVTGKRKSMPQLRGMIGGKVLEPHKWLDTFQSEESILRVQVYEDTGSGYSEENSVFLPEAYKGEKQMEVEYKVSGNVQTLRIDPAFDSCMCKIRELTFNGERVPVETRGILHVNGRIIKGKDGVSLVFPTKDPNINIHISKLQPKAENILYMKLDVVCLPLEMAEDMAGAVKKLF